MNKRDIWALLALLGLGIFGAFNMFGIRADLLTNFLLYTCISWMVWFGMRFIPVQLLEQNYKILYVVFIALFIITFIAGSRDVGSTRWIPIFSFRFQTAEFFKPVLILAMASILSSANKFTPRKTIITFALCAIPSFLVFLQPNLSSVLIYITTSAVMYYFSGVSTKYVVRGGLVALASAPILWMFMRDYQRARVIGFLNPESDPQGLSYNIHQSIISIGSGGFMGKGLGLGTQSRFQFLPEFHTDFAFASLVEQFGFIGGIAVLCLFALLIGRLIQSVFHQKQYSFSYLYLIGTIAMLMIEITINVGMNMGMLPVTGIALPFISYGGSSMISTMIMLGIAMRL